MTRSRTRPHHAPAAPFALELVGTEPGEMNAPSSSETSLPVALPSDGGHSPVGMV
ncbi:hypothetical protein ACLMAJ_31640 [Nocardia sp. KC 131]|uniref:hypothetical protein n=1 Tax=Nocardia arseniciresistens TaxID=3392119 RepID=UPI00398E3220